MGNKTKLALSSAFACTMALGLIGCNKEQPVGPVIPAEYNVSFTSEDLELKTNVTKIASDEDLVLKIQVKNEKKNEGKRLPKLNNVEEKDFITINSGNKILQFTDYNYVIDDSKEFATLSLKHEHYLGDIDIKAKAADIVTFTDTKLEIAGFGNTAEKTTILIDTFAEGFAAPETIHEVFFDGPLAESYNYDNSQGYGKLEIWHDDGVIPDSIVIKADAEQVTTNTLKIKFQGDEIGWGYDVGGAPHYTNRTYLADIVFDNWQEEEVIWAEGSNTVKKYVTVERGDDLSATISLNDWSDFDKESPMPMKDYKKNFNYTHEFSDERDVEGSLKDFVVIGHRKDGKGTDVIQSRLYSFVLSDHGRVANFNLDSSAYSNYTELEIICNVRQVANGVYVNFNRLNEYLTFGRHNYLYEDGDDLKFEINLDSEVTDYVLPKDEDTGDNGRVQIGFKEVGKGENPDWLFKLDPEDYKYEIQDGDARHQARVVIPRDKVEIDLEKIHQEDIVVEVNLVGKYDVGFTGDLTHLKFEDISEHKDPHWQDEDLDVKINVWRTDDDDPEETGGPERSTKFDYANTFRLVNSEDDNFEDLFNIVGYDDDMKPTAITDYTYEIANDEKGLPAAYVNVPNSAIGSYSYIEITSYAVRTHFLAAAPLDANAGTPTTSTLVEYQDSIRREDGTMLVAVDPEEKDLEVPFQLKEDSQKSSPWPKFTAKSLVKAEYDYYGNDEHDEASDPIIYPGDSGTFDWKVTPESVGHYKDRGVLKVSYPTDTSTEPFPAHNEDEILTFYTTTDTLMHDIKITSGTDHHTGDYSIENITNDGIQPTDNRWLEPLAEDGVLIFKVTVIKEGCKLPGSVTHECRILREDSVDIFDNYIDLHLFGGIDEEGRTVDGKTVTFKFRPSEAAQYNPHLCDGNIWIDCWDPVPVE